MFVHNYSFRASSAIMHDIITYCYCRRKHAIDVINLAKLTVHYNKYEYV